jgi:hypothetical protein
MTVEDAYKKAVELVVASKGSLSQHFAEFNPTTLIIDVMSRLLDEARFGEPGKSEGSTQFTPSSDFN